MERISNNNFQFKRGLAVFAGGNHIFYIMGVLKVLHDKGINFEALSTYSAGAAIISNILNGSFDQTVKLFCELTENNEKNIYFNRIFSFDESSNVFPHNNIYNQVVKEIIANNDICNADTKVRVIATGYRGIFPSLVGFLGMLSLLIYSKNKDTFGEKILYYFKKIFRLKELIYTNSDFCDSQKAVNIVMGTSTIYPFIKLKTVDEMFLIDGKHSMLNPVDLLNDCKYVLSVHAHKTWPIKRDNYYSIFPFKKVMVHPMDYTNPEAISAAYEQGIREGLDHYQRIKNTPFFE